MMLYYPEGTTDEEIDSERASVERSVTDAAENEDYEAFRSEYDIAETQGEFATKIDEGYEDDAASPVRASVLVAVIALSAFLLA